MKQATLITIAAALFLLFVTAFPQDKQQQQEQEILIKFQPDAKEAQINALETEVGLKQIKAIPELNLRVFKITSSKSAKEIIAICEKKPFVKYAEPNYQYKALKK